MQAELQSAIDKNNAFLPQLPSVSTPDTANPDAPVGYLMTPAQVYASCADSVVAIRGTGAMGSSAGSGFILSEDGYVATNYHVVERQTQLTVSTSDGKKLSAEYIGGNEANDIALIKVDAEGLKPVKVGNSSTLMVGEQVAAIGNPLGELASTLTVGYISAKDRIVTTDGVKINMIQTDAAINSGNSGGPLFNMRGEVVGITSAKYSGTTNSGATIEGIGFAIPMDDVMGMFNDLREHGYITGGYLGIEASDVDQNAIDLYGLPKGALVRLVVKGSCAEKGGMKVQDIIVDVGGHKVSSMNDLSRALNKFDAGNEIQIIVYRGGRELALTVVLDERPKELSDSSTNSQATVPTQPSPGGSIEDWFDFFLP
jgi:serine protease Do